MSLFDKYWNLRMQSAQRLLEAALDLIQHKPTRGAVAENAVREVLKTFLPRRWASASGFIVDLNKNPSQQIDVLLFDQLTNASVYRDENVVVLIEGGNPVGTEVKSVLNKTDLFDALDNIATLKRLDTTAKGCIFAYRGMRADTLKSHLRSWFKSRSKKPTFNSRFLPEMICIMERNLVVRRPSLATASHIFEIWESADPVVWSFLTQVLNDLKVANLTPLLPEPKMKSQLFTV